jgi:hypothetical protein
MFSFAEVMVWRTCEEFYTLVVSIKLETEEVFGICSDLAWCCLPQPSRSSGMLDCQAGSLCK